MNFLLHTTTIKLNGTIYKYERLQQYNERSHKATNKYFVNGKIVRNYKRYEVKEIFDCGSYRDYEVTTEKRWVK